MSMDPTPLALGSLRLVIPLRSRTEISDPMLANVSRTHCMIRNDGHSTMGRTKGPVKNRRDRRR